MNENDFERFRDSWTTGHEVSGRNRLPSDNAINLTFDLLADYPFELVLNALRLHSSKSSYAPTPSAILAILNIGNQRLSADEAWALCPASEKDTVVWTDEMASAFAVASDLLAEGDKIGSRMAFKGAYERICKEHEWLKQPIQWQVSLGHDPQGRESVIHRAVSQGRLSPESASQYLGLNHDDAGPIAGLLSGKVVPHPKAHSVPLARLKEIKKIIDAAHDVRWSRREERVLERVEKQQSFDLAKEKALNALDEKMNAQ